MTIQQPKVTVIIPTYNRAHYLHIALQSVFAQTFTDFEIIVVDDGSTDDTAIILRQITDHRLCYIRQEHTGISAALNTGIHAARGTYIARLDSDDIWLPQMLTIEVGVLDAQPEISVVYAKVQTMDQVGTPLPETFGLPERYPGESFRSMLYEDCTSSVTVIARRVCFDRVGLYDELLSTSEDWDMWLRVARHYRFAYVDRILAWSRRHEGSITNPRSAHFAKVIEGRKRVIDKIFSTTELPPAIVAMKSIAYRNLYTEIGLRWLEVGAIRKAFRAFWRAVGVGGNPAITLIRIVWFVLVRQFFRRFVWGRRFVEETANLRRRWRERKSFLKGS